MRAATCFQPKWYKGLMLNNCACLWAAKDAPQLIGRAFLDNCEQATSGRVRQAIQEVHTSISLRIQQILGNTQECTYTLLLAHVRSHRAMKLCILSTLPCSPPEQPCKVALERLGPVHPYMHDSLGACASSAGQGQSHFDSGHCRPAHTPPRRILVTWAPPRRVAGGWPMRQLPAARAHSQPSRQQKRNVEVAPRSILGARALPTTGSSRGASQREKSTVTVACWPSPEASPPARQLTSSA